MSTSQGGAGSGEQQSGSIQDMVREMELGGEDIKALGEAEMEQVGEGGYGEVFLIKSNKFKVSQGYGGRPSLKFLHGIPRGF